MAKVDYTLYLSGAVDDYGWNPYEFRMLARIYRRCSSKGGFTGIFYESVPSLRRSLNMSLQTVRRTLKILEMAGAIAAVVRPGTSTAYRVLDAANWVDSERLDEIRAKATTIKNNRGNESDTTTKIDRSPLPKTTGVPLSKTIDKGFPSEVFPLKEKKEADAAIAAVESNPVETRIWTDGVELLVRGGMDRKHTRPFLGKQAKEFGKEKLAEAIAVTQSVNPADPKAYLVGVLQERATAGVRERSRVGAHDSNRVFEPYASECQRCDDRGYLELRYNAEINNHEEVPCPDCSGGIGDNNEN